MTVRETAQGVDPSASEPRKISPDVQGAAKIRYLLRRALASEAAGWRSIGRAIARRPQVPAAASAHRYDAPVRTIMIVFVALSAVEVPIIDLIVHRWPAVRFPLLALGIWGVLTMLGMLLGNSTRPHAVGPDGIRVRHGGEVDIDLRWEVIASVGRTRRSLSARGLTLTGEPHDQALNQVVQDGTDIDITLEGPTTLALPAGDVVVTSVRIAVDDVPAFLDAVRTHIP